MSASSNASQALIATISRARAGRAVIAAASPVDPTDRAVTDIIADWAATKGTIGIRVCLRTNVSTDPADPAINRVLATAAQHSLPVDLACTGRLDQATQSRADPQYAAGDRPSWPLTQPHEPPPPAQPLADLPKLLALAARDNVAVKVSGACTLSHEPFPYKDIWDPLGRIFDAFGFDRCMWGTDWTRAVGLLTYEQGVEAFRVTDRLSEGDRAALMGETLTAGLQLGAGASLTALRRPPRGEKPTATGSSRLRRRRSAAGRQFSSSAGPDRCAAWRDR